MEDFIIYLLKNENDLFRANISEDLKQLIICLSTVSKLINNENNKLKFLHDHLKSIIKRKINLIKFNIELEYEPEIFVKRILFIDLLDIFNNIKLFKYPKLISEIWNEDESQGDCPFAVNLERVQTTGGGSCLLHAILLGLSTFMQRLPYVDTYPYNGNDVRKDKKHFFRYSREYIGNIYRIIISNLKIYNSFERSSLISSQIKKNINNVYEPISIMIPYLDIKIAYKLLKLLRYNLIVIDSVRKIIYNSKYNKNEFEKYIIIFKNDYEYQLIKKKNTKKTIYSKNELLDIFNPDIFKEGHEYYFNYNNELKFTEELL